MCKQEETSINPGPTGILRAMEKKRSGAEMPRKMSYMSIK